MRANVKMTPRQKAGRRPFSLPLRLKYLGFILIPGILIFSIAYAFSFRFNSVFPLRSIVFSGNVHLSDEELKGLSGVTIGDSLLALSSRRVFSRLSESPWLRSVSVRKELPDSIHILVREAEPLALLEMKGHTFIVDDRGTLLEELKDTQIPFLPIILGNPFKEKEVFSEAVTLARTVKETGLLSRKNHIEIIAHKPRELTMNIDGTVVKIGTGEYNEKLDRLMELEDEIRKRGIPVDYIDLRFSNRVVVKALAEVIHP